MMIEPLVYPLFQHEIIHQYAQLVDQCQARGRKCNDYIDQLLHFMKNACDLASPVNREQKKIYEYIQSLKG